MVIQPENVPEAAREPSWQMGKVISQRRFVGY